MLKFYSTPNKSKFYLPDFAVDGIFADNERWAGLGDIDGFKNFPPLRNEVEEVGVSASVGVELCGIMKWMTL